MNVVARVDDRDVDVAPGLEAAGVRDVRAAQQLPGRAALADLDPARRVRGGDPDADRVDVDQVDVGECDRHVVREEADVLGAAERVGGGLVADRAVLVVVLDLLALGLQHGQLAAAHRRDLAVRRAAVGVAGLEHVGDLVRVGVPAVGLEDERALAAGLLLHRMAVVVVAEDQLDDDVRAVDAAGGGRAVLDVVDADLVAIRSPNANTPPATGHSIFTSGAVLPTETTTFAVPVRPCASVTVRMAVKLPSSV